MRCVTCPGHANKGKIHEQQSAILPVGRAGLLLKSGKEPDLDDIRHSWSAPHEEFALFHAAHFRFVVPSFPMPAPSSNHLRLSVVIPVFNRRKIVLDTLASIHRQTTPPWRVIIVDDGSSDGSAEAIEAWLTTNPLPCEVEVLRQPNGGVSTARNRGALAVPDADLLAFLDSDDLWPDDFVARAIQTFHDHPEITGAYFDSEIRKLSVDGNLITRKLNKHSGRRWKGPELIYRAYPGTPAIVLRSSVFKQTGGFPVGLHLGEDFIFFLLASAAGPWRHVPGLPVIYRYFQSTSHLSSTKAPEDFLQFARALESIAAQHGFTKQFRHVISHRWRRAGKAMKDAGRNDEARQCYQRAIVSNPWDIKARWRKFSL